MKQILLAAAPLAGLLVIGSATAQSYDCYVVCSPPRVYCLPPGQTMPPIYKICGSSSQTPEAQSLSASLGPSAALQTAPACSAQQVFNEETQTFDWQMVCD